MVTREQIVAEVRGWVGTPVRHQGQRKGVAADCKGWPLACRSLWECPRRRASPPASGTTWGFQGRDLLEGLRKRP
jgi:hypothetical protein